MISDRREEESEDREKNKVEKYNSRLRKKRR